MRLAIISSRKLYDYVLDTIEKHPSLDMTPFCIADWRKPMRDVFRGIPLIGLSALKAQDFDAVLVTVSNPHRMNEIVLKLHERQFSNVYIVRLFPLAMRADFLDANGFNLDYVDRLNLIEDTFLAHVESLVCDHCNLNCKSCGAFSPFVHTKHIANIEQYASDMERLSKLFSTISVVNLLGGEPLLEPDLAVDMSRIAREYYPNSDLRILTNGILVPSMKPEFWDKLNKLHASVEVTVYPAVFPNLPKIEETLLNAGVAYRIAKVNTFGRWLLAEPHGNEVFNNDQCMCSGCHFLRDGHLAKCGTAWLMGYLAPAIGREPEEFRTRDAIDLYADDLDAWEVLRKLTGPADICGQCAWNRIEQHDWEPVRHFPPDPGDWLLDDAEKQDGNTGQEDHVPRNLVPDGAYYATFRKTVQTNSGK
ncbi:MAG: radical SAM protein [Acidaminococcaceae bacterium]|nr:radical SAM protein [Acidaminococcaceae bacterium]